MLDVLFNVFKKRSPTINTRFHVYSRLSSSAFVPESRYIQFIHGYSVIKVHSYKSLLKSNLFWGLLRGHLDNLLQVEKEKKSKKFLSKCIARGIEKECHFFWQIWQKMVHNRYYDTV